MANLRLCLAPVAQLDRALASGAKGCGFDPRRAQNAWLQCTFTEYLSIFSGFESFPCPNGFAPYRSFLRRKPVAFGHLAVPGRARLRIAKPSFSKHRFSFQRRCV